MNSLGQDNFFLLLLSCLFTTSISTPQEGCVVSTCPNDLTHGGCICQKICGDSIRMIDCNGDCIETGVPEGCSNGKSYVNYNCTQNCTCINNEFHCGINYQCSPHATCTVKSGVRKCYCKDGYEGDGETCDSANFTDCYDAYQAGHRKDGVYTILPKGWPGSPFEVFCNMTFGGGGWTVVQRRVDGVTNFYRNWTEYKNGFGTLNEGNDFWLGNEQLHYLTNQKDYKLRFDSIRSDNLAMHEEYTEFKIGNESTNYQLISAYYRIGNTGYTSSLHFNRGKQFSTFDQDNDGCGFHHCATKHRGGWWYGWYSWCEECEYDYSWCSYFETKNDCYNQCTWINLNGDYQGGNGENIFYTSYGPSCNVMFSEMKIRPYSPQGVSSRQSSP